MKNIRLGKDITIKWKVQPIDGDLSLFIIDEKISKLNILKIDAGTNNYNTY